MIRRVAAWAAGEAVDALAHGARPSAALVALAAVSVVL